MPQSRRDNKDNRVSAPITRDASKVKPKKPPGRSRSTSFSTPTSPLIPPSEPVFESLQLKDNSTPIIPEVVDHAHKDENDQLPPENINVSRNLSLEGIKTIQDNLLTDISPQESSEFSEPDKMRRIKGNCPCLTSSQGTAWMITCITCAQTWHTSCCNLKGASLLSKKDILALTQDWECPWCYTCPFDKKTGHSSSKKSSLLLSNELCSSVATVIQDKFDDLIKTHHKPDIEGIQDKLDSLTKLVDSIKMPSHVPSTNQFHIPKLLDPPKEVSIQTECPETAINVQKPDYLSPEKAQDVRQLMEKLKSENKFKQKKGRYTLSYGVEYKYPGAQDKPHSPDIPLELQNLITKMEDDFNLPQHKVPNSVLINFYPAKTKPSDPASCLPKHSDNEIEIDPNTDIFTYSVGCSRDIVFENVHKNTKNSPTVHTATDNSIYTMTRASQAWFTHQITDVETCSERFSITLRKISTNTRSTLIIGDSNSKEIKFGSGRGYIGEKYPGQRIKASKIKDINPADSVGYTNVVLLCGTNNLRVGEVPKENSQEYIDGLVSTLKHKCEQIKLISNANIIIMPVLPTRDAIMNQYICYFNAQVYESEFRQNSHITMPPMYSFLDSSNKLSVDLSRDGDSIHLGSRGICKLVSVIKEAIFYSMKANAQVSRTGHKKGGGHGPGRPP